MTLNSISDSNRNVMGGAKLIGPALPSQRFEVSVILRRRAALPPHSWSHSPKTRTYLTHAQITEQHGADPADIAKVEKSISESTIVIRKSPKRLCEKN